MIKQFTTSIVVLRELSTQPEVLLIHHKKFDKWMIPGGHIEANEDPVEAAVREVKEETGVHIDFISFVHRKLPVSDSVWLFPPEYLYQQLIPARKHEEEHYHIDLTYVALAQTCDLIANTSETNGAQWVPISELDSLNMFNGTKSILKDLQEKILHKQAYIV